MPATATRPVSPNRRKPRSDDNTQNNDAPFAKAFREITKKHTHTVLAEQLDCAITTVSYLAHGQRPPSARILEAIRDKYPEYYRRCFNAAMQQIGAEQAAVALRVDNLDPDQLRLSMLLSFTWPEMSRDTRRMLTASILKLMRAQGWELPQEPVQ